MYEQNRLVQSLLNRTNNDKSFVKRLLFCPINPFNFFYNQLILDIETYRIHVCLALPGWRRHGYGMRNSDSEGSMEQKLW